MRNSDSLLIVYGLASAASWGAGDFSGGLATKQTSVYRVILISQIVGVTLLLAFAMLVAENLPSFDNLLLGALAGISATLGLVALYRGLAHGQMGIVAPVAAVVAAALPVLVALFAEGLPSIPQLCGFGLALPAVWLLSGAERDRRLTRRDLRLPVFAGIGFALFFILIDRVDDSALFWPLVAARLASISILSLVNIAQRHREALTGRQLGLITIAGVCDAGGTAFFALATHVGRLDISTILSSLYPVATVALAWIILKERFKRQQWAGIVIALVALVLIAM
jgi:drug/metabolite transporter (DMT)-like permease